MKFYLETERLILREFQDKDTDGIFELDSNPEVHKYLGNNPITNHKQAEDIIAFFHKQYKENGIGRFAAFEKESGNFIGWSGLKLNKGEKEELNGFTNFIDIGYRLIPKYWGKGYASESAIACLDFGFKQMNYDIIYGAAETDNIGSNKILQKIGLQYVNNFLFEGTDAKWYELKKTDYER
ncbi:GNAT family acetyltransferase [Tenacibaculum holothuriorum]|uniref:GNAT family acetyltransferase n=1 Tax=Tenacibaculum holothuriorum TaxID=1635173 RepID=A0A1Y2PGL1_9FLAO|nr:GNAT family N-acetyltransferase [Tenacibaculum holothuriorum]OSY88818.1 GNAT family acetyltransferase [Tenacibaculum holothuriorum]